MEYIDKYEKNLEAVLHEYLVSRGEVDEMRPDAPDIEGKWEQICQSYIPDGVREFEGYPSVSLGWIMFVGMAVAQLWDVNWEKYSKMDDLYLFLRDARGYDYMDEYICERVLKVKGKQAEKVTQLVGDVAVKAHGMLMHERFENGTPEAFHAYVRTLHQLYTAGAAVQLRRMGYHMTPMTLN
ncbi:MAG: hypothetical protein Q4C30_05910 [Bacteroidia bacterium]|nr:hypothetical protein [Bacteroidia bacterium]